MAAGTPVVSTPLGAEGLDVTPEEDFLRAAATEPETWVRHLERLAANPERRMQLAEAGRRLVRRKYDWGALGTQLVTTYADWLRDAR
jgi:glycosyltransferase involved in cell wall biosynthesis